MSRWPRVHPTSPFLIGGGFCNCQIGVVPDQNRLGVSSRKGDGMLGWTRKFQEMVQRSIVSSVLFLDLDKFLRPSSHGGVSLILIRLQVNALRFVFRNIGFAR